MDYIYNDGELYHYGIKGQKWGIRRWQNEDGSLTSEGKKKYLKEYRLDNRIAYETGKMATVAGRALTAAQKKARRKTVAYDRKPSARRLIRKEAADKTVDMLVEMAERTRAKAEAHQKKLVEKYGSEAVSSLKYDKHGRVNERVHTGAEWAAATLGNAASVAGAHFGHLPVALIYVPKTKNQMGRDVRNHVYSANKRAIKYKP